MNNKDKGRNNRFSYWFKKTVCSVFFLGYFPFAPGTAGSLLTVILLFIFRGKISFLFSPEYCLQYWVTVIILTGAGIFLSKGAKSIFGTEDPSHIIIDECIGQFITFFMLPLTWRVLLLGFVLFRFFDIVKPFPVYKFEEIEGGTGIVMDDFAAGVLANISLIFFMAIYHGIISFL